MSHTPKPQRAQEPVSARTGPTDIGTAPARAAARRKAWGSNQHTGSQERVYAAVQQGVSDAQAIATWTGLDRFAVKNAINRLVSAGMIRRRMAGGYSCAKTTCLLAEVWR